VPSNKGYLIYYTS